MRPLGFAILVLTSVAVAQIARAQPAREVPVGTNIDWSHARDPERVRYRSGDVTLSVRAVTSGDDPDSRLARPVVTIQMQGFPPVEVEGSDTPASFDHRLAVGRWDAERPYVLFQTYTGGAHCCNQVYAVLPDGSRLRVVDLGEWDGGPSDTLPTDVDGDGRLDFVFSDNSFLYLFASYADSFAPPLILNIVDGRTEDVSDRPGFRPLFEQSMRESRAVCVDPRRTPNGACAAYVASAARIGRFDEAWAEMLTHFDLNSTWELPAGCRQQRVASECPEPARITFGDYPSALRYFLVSAGYIDK